MTPLNILLVDDDPDQLLLINHYIKKSRIPLDLLHAAENAQVAMGKFISSGKQVYDMVITDVDMPGMSGTALAAELRLIRPDLTIVIYSAYTNIITLQGNTAADYILDKTFSENIFIDLLQFMAKKISRQEHKSGVLMGACEYG